MGNLHRILAIQEIWSRILGWYRGSVLFELLTYFDNALSASGNGSYQNFSVSSSGLITIRSLLIGLTLGILIAAGWSVHTKREQGGLIRKMLAEGCLSPETAKTLHELGYYSSLSVRRELTNGLLFRRLVVPAEESDGKPDFAKTAFYIPEEQKYLAEVRFEKKGSSVGAYLIGTALTLILLVLICRYLSLILTFADRILSVL